MSRKIWTGIILIGLGVAIAYVFLFRRHGPSLPSLSSVSAGNVVDANNLFALDFYSRLKVRESGNIFFSPFSISSALAMAYEGAKGRTAEEMRSVFYFPGDNALRRAGYVEAYDRINRSDKAYKLSVANALWAQKDYRFLKEYFDVIEKYYQGKAVNLDFIKDPKGSMVTINKWVEERTNNKIKNLISGIGPETRLILTNAVYFKGDWLSPFEKSKTKPEDFMVRKDNTIKVPMMRQTKTFSYAANDSLQALELPYTGDNLSMLLLLPIVQDLASLESSLSAAKLSELKKTLKPQQVAVILPRFKVETKYDRMADYLAAMGMPAAFNSSADFSGMDATRDLYISQVIHKAFVEVDEKGTEAAAATAVFLAGSAAHTKIPVFRVDHPFIFLIQEKATGNILFMGRIVNPAL